MTPSPFMKTIKRTAVRIAFCIMLSTCIASSPASAKGHREIVGYVSGVWSYPFYPIIDGRAVYPILALVQVFTQDAEFVTEVATDNNGYFEIADLKPGTYAITALAITPPPVYFLRYVPVTQTATLHKKSDVQMEFLLNLFPYPPVWPK